MSLLGTQVYANPDTPCWISSTGGEVTGDLTVDGNLTVNLATNLNGPLNANSDVNVGATLFFAPPTGDEQAIAVDSLGTIVYIQAGDSVKFGKLGQTSTNTTLTVSAPGSNQDIFTTNFISAVGPVPFQLVIATKSISPVPVSPAPATAFAVDFPYPITDKEEYDVQARGVITLASGSSDPDDAVAFTLDAGTGVNAVVTSVFYPEAPGANGQWAIRSRVICDNTQPSLGIQAQCILHGASTAAYSATLSQLDVVRVA